MKYYIWSYRKRAWWGPDKSGYTHRLLHETGLYSEADAADIVLSGPPSANVAVDTHFRSRFENLTAEEVEAELESLRRL